MAKQKPNTKFSPDMLPAATMVEVIRTDKNGESVKKVMKYGEWRVLVKQPGFVYRAYQIGFSQFNLK